MTLEPSSGKEDVPSVGVAIATIAAYATAEKGMQRHDAVARSEGDLPKCASG